MKISVTYSSEYTVIFFSDFNNVFSHITSFTFISMMPLIRTYSDKRSKDKDKPLDGKVCPNFGLVVSRF